MGKPVDLKIARIIDANFNRAREGLRVCEDICRFIQNKTKLTRSFKETRHQLTAVLRRLPIAKFILARDVANDVGRTSTETEFRRSSVADVFYANVQRAKESLRVLEELVKLIDVPAAESLKRLRYRIYALEQETLKDLCR